MSKDLAPRSQDKKMAEYRTLWTMHTTTM